jgi:SAM-dependent methyltransferase
MILDFGCGDGHRWNENSDDVIGMDINLNRLSMAKSRILVVQCDGRFLPFRSCIFSSVISDSVLEHIPDYARGVSEIRRVLVVGGICTILQPVDNDPIFIVARRVVRNWRGDSVYSYFTSRQLLRTLSIFFKLRSVSYLPNAPFAGMFGFFNRKTPRLLVRIDHFYCLVCERISIFHWKAIIEGAKGS